MAQIEMENTVVDIRGFGYYAPFGTVVPKTLGPLPAEFKSFGAVGPAGWRETPDTTTEKLPIYGDPALGRVIVTGSSYEVEADLLEVSKSKDLVGLLYGDIDTTVGEYTASPGRTSDLVVVVLDFYNVGNVHVDRKYFPGRVIVSGGTTHDGQGYRVTPIRISSEGDPKIINPDFIEVPEG